MTEIKTIIPGVTVYAPADFGLEAVADQPARHAIALAVRVHRQNSRQGTLGCKDRTALVSRSNKKPWKQKGTGRARAGTPRSPIWRGGAVSHGPQPRVRKLSLPVKMNHLALQSIVGAKLLTGSLLSLNWTPVSKCNEAYKVLRQNELHVAPVVMLYDIYDSETFLAFSNISNILLVSYDAVHVDALGRGKYIVFLEKDKDSFNSMVQKWLN